MSSVDIRQVTKTYGDVHALDKVSLTFAEGEFFGLLGPSGSGKTTLLRSIAGFVNPTGGQILVDGTDISHIPTHKRDIGMVFQNYALFPHMAVFDNIAYPLAVRRVASAEINLRVNKILELVQLGGYGSRRPRELSGGQQQRVALARALVSRPRVLLLDEPLGALDKNLRQQMQIELRQIQREVGITTILVTHDQEEALTLSDRIAIFRKGEVVQVGRPDDVYENPRDAFAAEFFGSTNFLKGKSLGKQGVLGAVELSDGTRILTSYALPSSGSPITLTVRPEKVLIQGEGQAVTDQGTSLNVLSATVIQPVYMGASVTYQLSTSPADFSVFQQNREAKRFEAGASVKISWLPQHTVVLDA
ncbi:MAG TPA: ABC transporter ATP-binding protein [Stellaceae bacterium]|nr:ABC transporter ATP-binding protein [Stellaceae bacterium]